MALLIIEGIRINTSTRDFVTGDVSPEKIETVMKAIKQFEDTSCTQLIPVFMELADQRSALFPLTFAVNFCRKNAKSNIAFRNSYSFFERDIESIFAFFRSEITAATRSYVKRILLMLWTTTTIRNLSELSEPVWCAWASSLKEPNTQFKKELGFNSQDVRALRILASYMDAFYPSELGYLRQLKVQRKPNVGNITGKSRAFLDNPPVEFSAWAEIFESHMLLMKFKNSKMPNGAFRILATWLEQYPTKTFSDPKMFLSKPRLTPSLIEYLKSVDGQQLNVTKRSQVSFIMGMVENFIDENMVLIEGGERTVLGHSVVSTTEKRTFALEAESTSSAKVQTSSNPMPLKWVRELQNILTENDWAWPKSQGSQWTTLNYKGAPKNIWNPVCAYLIYSMTEIPWRKIQFKALDSGEADSDRYDFLNDQWIPNTGPIAGYWDRHPTARKKMRGVLNRRGDNFCFYVNTNKTGDRQHGHGEMSGYYVPWLHTPIIQLFSDLRNWQEEYNPLKEPTSYSDVSSAFYGPDAPSKNVEENIPARCYLFRDVQGQESKLAPPTDNRLYSLWRLLMDELERRLREKGDDATIILSRNKSGGPQVAHFNMHGLRVSGLTAFAEAGVPIEILSKLVAGHASILMTIYYLKYDAAHITDVLSDARQQVEAIAAKDFGRFLRNQSIDAAMEVAVAKESYTLEALTNGELSHDQFFDTGLGVCPHNGTRCADGVALSGGRTAAVPGEAKNCLLCRHFITGEPWLIPLVLKQQVFSGQASDLANRLKELGNELENAESDRAEQIVNVGLGEVTPALVRRIRQLENEIERDSLSLDDLLSIMNRNHLIIEQIKILQHCHEGEKGSALLADMGAEIGGYREGTRFELIDTVLQAGRIYPILQDDKFEQERRRYIDAIMFNNDLTPLSMLSLTEDQKRRASDAAGKWLMTKVGAQQTQLLISGAQTLQEIGFESDDLREKIESSTTGSIHTDTDKRGELS